MTGLTVLRSLELLPVLELEPGRFAAREYPLPSGSGLEMPEAWRRYWLDCLTDAGITGLSPLRPASWHVPTRDLIETAILEKILNTICRVWGGIEALSDPDCEPVLSGGLALLSGGEVLVEPTCCSDLGNLSNWREAAGYQGLTWQTLWIGHPWLSIRHQYGSLVITEPHDSKPPEGRWAVQPDVLGRAIAAAEVELEDFARRLRRALVSLGSGDRGGGLARQLAGLAS